MAKPGKKKVKRTVSKAVVHVKATFNNTIVTITDVQGNTLCWASSGTITTTATREEAVADRAHNQDRDGHQVRAPLLQPGSRPRARKLQTKERKEDKGAQLQRLLSRAESAGGGLRAR